MDPGSAGIAFIGFAASLATLVAVVAKSSKILYELRRELRDVPDDVKTFLEQFAVFQNLLNELSTRLHEPQDIGTLRGLHDLLELSMKQMQTDMDDFQVVLFKLHRAVDNPDSRMIRLRVRYHFNEVRKYQGRIATHIVILTYIQSMVNERKLDTILNHTTKAIDTTSSSFQTICSKLAATEVLDYERYGSCQQVLSRVEKRIHSLEDQLSIQNLTLSSPGQSTLNTCHSQSNPTAGTAKVVDLSVNVYSLPLGLLRIISARIMQVGSPNELGVPWREKSTFSMTFTPPHWLSKIMLTAELQMYGTLNGALPTISVSLNPFTINDHPLFVQAIIDFDVARLQMLFKDGLARPTDHLPPAQSGGDPRSLLAFTLMYGGHSLSQRYRMWKFLLENGAPLPTPLDTAMIYWNNKVTGDGIQDRDLWRKLLRSYMVNGGIAVSQCVNTQDPVLSTSLLRSMISIEAVQDCLLLQSEPWVPEDLPMSEVWLISTLAHTNDHFKKLMEEYLNSFQTRHCATRKYHGKSAFESAFGIQKTVSQFKNASPHYRSEFLDLLSGWGDPSMFIPFVDGGVDVNEWGTWWIYLGQAACKQKPEMHHAAFDINIKGLQALPWFLRPEKLLPKDEESLALFLNEIAVLADGEGYDPFLAMSKSRKALRVYPQALNILLRNGYCKPWSLHGSANVLFKESYMYLAIRYGYTEAVQLVLDYGVKVNTQIGDNFVVYDYMATLKLYTWLTLAVERGDASCTEVLVKNGASIHSPDGLGRSALELARLNIVSAHPRILKDYTFTAVGDSSTLAEDMETLAVLERALATRPSSETSSRTSRSIRNLIYIILPNALTRCLSPVISLFSSASHQVSRISFQDALIIRSCYVFFYCALFYYEIVHIVGWIASIPLPPRAGALLPTVVVLLVALGLAYI